MRILPLIPTPILITIPILMCRSRNNCFVDGSLFRTETHSEIRRVLNGRGIDAKRFRALHDQAVQGAPQVPCLPLAETRVMIAALRGAGLRLGVLTSDDRATTEPFVTSGYVVE